ncbi:MULTISPECIES: ATP-binding cassette domain-containing protein [unclassified Brevibacterium]|uniref:ATP-binding cassette domain-containing protein n=1 Tax=unclassified Brevibacterium TaxID=2614124 RepID=UPI0010923F13|nr:ATP-binding cassette domain-containing protein [Brevibacterium sp. S22]TGD29404.1 ATP-binding cassette domain-containing protein [Brevibacterium sp. S22]
MTEPVIGIRTATLSLPGTGEVLSALNLEMRLGGITWLVGESGAGKSTLCNLLAGLSPVDAKVSGVLDLSEIVGARDGRVASEKRDITEAAAPGDGRIGLGAGQGRTDLGTRWGRIGLGTRQGRRAMAKLRRSGVIAWAPQNAMDTFPPAMRLTEWFSRTGLDSPDLAAYGLENSILRRLPHQVSGGQISRISLAAAVAKSPRLLVCDEPTAGLDPEQADAVVGVLNDQASAGSRAVLAVTHDLSGLQRNARPGDRVAVAFNGHIVEDCSVAAFFAGRAANAYVQALAAAAPAAGAHPLPLADGARPKPWVYRDGDELRRLGEESVRTAGQGQPAGRMRTASGSGPKHIDDGGGSE